MFGLEHKVIILMGFEHPRNLFAPDVGMQTVIDQFAKIGAPTPKVIVGIDNRYFQCLRLCLEGNQLHGHW